MASNYTENYGLCQWEATDQVLRTDFNEDNAKVDAAIAGNTAAIVALTGQLAQKGNCQIETFTYIGTGTYGQSNPTRINFSAKPLYFVVMGYSDNFMFGCGEEDHAYTVNYSGGSNSTDVVYSNVTWIGNQLQIYHLARPQYQFNVKDIKYRVVALYAADL